MKDCLNQSRTKQAVMLPWHMRRVLAAWLGLALLAITIFANGAMPAPPPGIVTPAEEQLFGDRIVICTPGGLIVVDRDGKPVPAKDTERHAQICVFCLPLMHGGLGGPPVADTGLLNPPTEFTLVQRPATVANHVPARLVLGAVSPRGPPRVV